MTQETQATSRREQILQTLAEMLEQENGGRITTAALARQVGVSEAALYRHFPSKAKMFEALIGFIEQSVFERIQAIIEGTRRDQAPASECIRLILTLVLTFASRNPGLCRLLNGEILSGDVARLRPRMAQFFERLETQLKQVLREAEIQQGLRLPSTVTTYANLLMSVIEGRIGQYVRSGFRRAPTELWEDQWQLLAAPLTGLAHLRP
ncbi:nucleoid occlusion factor SlmA [Halotalea alkalilenta]|uniref:Nucleoid occlusion factor SlmA n=1 Tax=Halotalea alkalilenta TaxID=376489 RepID=A0A172YJ64_9GAMM|nr:nucleoid occlusion factor SlmA [Halotalea alkalilenta]ANF59239.1 nucleoid occlusion factor SlmA [Halotalea alkalilenta]